MIEKILNAFGIRNNIVKEEIILLPNTPQNIYTYPKNFDYLPFFLQNTFEEWVRRKVYLLERKSITFNNVYISWHGVIFKNMTVFIPSLMYPALINQFNGRFLLRQWIGKRQALPKDQRLALVFDQWSAVNYFHWIIEVVPKLALLASRHSDSTLLLPANLPDYVLATIKVFGFNKYISIGEGTIYSAKSLLWLERTGSFWLQDIHLLQETRRTILKYYNLQSIIPHRRIYVSRSKAKIRRLINELSLGNLLIEYGFEVVFFEEMLFHDQVKLAAEASVLVGVHGANLTNMLFMAPQTALVELINQDSANLAYFKLAAYCNVNYYCQPCHSVDEAATNDSDFSVNVDEFAQVLKQICA